MVGADTATLRKYYLEGKYYEEERKDSRLAYLSYVKAARRGYAPAQTAVGMLFLKNASGAVSLSPRDFYKSNGNMAASWFKSALAQNPNDALAQYGLGKLYIDGYYEHRHPNASHHIVQDIPQGLRLLELSANQGQVESQIALVSIYAKSNPTKSLFYREKAAMQGHAPSQYELGRFYQNRGGRQNLDIALKWYQQAAAQNHRQAWIQAMLITGEAKHYPCYVGGPYGIPIRQPGIARRPDDWCL